VQVFLRTFGKSRERRANLQVIRRQKRKISQIAKFTCTFAFDLLFLAIILSKTCIFAGP
jgi:hypothetical protein